MKFNYRVVWTDISKNRQDWCDAQDSPNIAVFVAKQKASAGMRDVFIQVICERSGDNAQKTQENAV